jgi:hypothetical protein
MNGIIKIKKWKKNNQNMYIILKILNNLKEITSELIKV